jgi:dimethylglycine dehydrogenase
MLRARDAGPVRKLATFVVDAADADVIGDEPIWRDGKVVGWVTSGGYAHHSRASVALGYVEAGAFDAAAPYEIEIIGETRAARIAAEPLFDPKGVRMRG